MKAEKKNETEFNPVTLTLETQEEVNTLMAIGRTSNGVPDVVNRWTHVENNKIKKLCNNLTECLNIFETKKDEN